MKKANKVIKAMSMEEIEAMVLADLAGLSTQGPILYGEDEAQEPGEVEAAAQVATTHTGRLGWNLDGLL